MELVEDVLNAKYFPVDSRERLKATLISLVLLLAILIMVIDVYESILQEFWFISMVESGSAFIFFLTYFLFPHNLALQKVIYIVLFILAFLFIISLTVEGANFQFALFWLATLPIYIFFFLGLKRGMRWTGVIVFILLLTALNAELEWYPPLYQTSFMLQLTVGYLAISYLLYALEKERLGYEKNLTRALADKEILLKEVHHRTKNSMQIIIALFDTQSLKIENLKCKKIIEANVDRLKSIALVHEYLYVGDNHDRVEIDKYLREIVKNFQQLTPHTILADIDPFVLDMKIVMNLGLVFNEALVNAIKHAYEETETGIIEVSLKGIGNNRCMLSVKDYGKGFDTEKKYNTLGLTLIKKIANILDEKAIEIDGKNGTKINVYCTLEEKL